MVTGDLRDSAYAVKRGGNRMQVGWRIYYASYVDRRGRSRGFVNRVIVEAIRRQRAQQLRATPEGRRQARREARQRERRVPR